MGLLDDMEKLQYGKPISDAIDSVVQMLANRQIAGLTTSAIQQAIKEGGALTPTGEDPNARIGSALSLDVLSRLPQMLKATQGQFTEPVRNAMSLSDMLLNPAEKASRVEYNKALTKEAEKATISMSQLATGQVNNLFAEGQEVLKDAKMPEYGSTLAQLASRHTDNVRGVDYYGLATDMVNTTHPEYNDAQKNQERNKLAAILSGAVYGKIAAAKQAKEMKDEQLMAGLLKQWDDNPMLQQQEMAELKRQLGGQDPSALQQDMWKKRWLQGQFQIIRSVADESESGQTPQDNIRAIIAKNRAAAAHAQPPTPTTPTRSPRSVPAPPQPNSYEVSKETMRQTEEAIRMEQLWEKLQNQEPSAQEKADFSPSGIAKSGKRLSKR